MEMRKEKKTKSPRYEQKKKQKKQKNNNNQTVGTFESCDLFWGSNAPYFDPSISERLNKQNDNKEKMIKQKQNFNIIKTSIQLRNNNTTSQ
jgi:hypothetical protein